MWWYDANKDARYTPEIVHEALRRRARRRSREWLALVGDDDAAARRRRHRREGRDRRCSRRTARSTRRSRKLDDARGPARQRAARRAGDAAARARARAPRRRRAPLPVPLDASSPIDARRVDALNALFERLGFAELLVERRRATQRRASARRGRRRRGAAALGAAPSRCTRCSRIRRRCAKRRRASRSSRATATPATCRATARRGRRSRRGSPTPSAPKIGHDLVGTLVALRRAGIELARHRRRLGVRVAPHRSRATGRRTSSRSSRSTCSAARCPTTTRCAASASSARRGARCRRERAGAYAGQRADASRGDLARRSRPSVDADAARRVPRARGDAACAWSCAASSSIPPSSTAPRRRSPTIEAELAGADRGARRPRVQHQLVEAARHGAVRGAEAADRRATRRPAGAPSIEALERIEHAHPIVPLVHPLARCCAGCATTGSSRCAACIDADGRVHSRFHPARSFSGAAGQHEPRPRRACPAARRRWRMIRRAFVAPPGHLLMSVDFNQLGLHVLAHLTKDPGARRAAARSAPTCTGSPRRRCSRSRAEAVTLEERQLGKVVNFATFAGPGRERARAAARRRRPPRRRSTSRASIATTRRCARSRTSSCGSRSERGYIVTIAGRRWPIGGLESLDSHAALVRRAPRAPRDARRLGRRRLAPRAARRRPRAARARASRAVPVVAGRRRGAVRGPRGRAARGRARSARDAMRDAFAARGAARRRRRGREELGRPRAGLVRLGPALPDTGRLGRPLDIQPLEGAPRHWE